MKPTIKLQLHCNKHTKQEGGKDLKFMLKISNKKSQG